MQHNIPDRVLKDVASFASKHNVESIRLFGSRAKGTHTERSDIDIAVHAPADPRQLRSRVYDSAKDALREAQ